MANSKNEKRIELAKAKICSSYGTEDGEFSSNLFVELHLEEMESEYWIEHFDCEKPSPQTLLNGLLLIDSWDSEEDGVIDTYDFSLPNDASNYMLSVRFDSKDNIIEFNMES